MTTFIFGSQRNNRDASLETEDNSEKCNDVYDVDGIVCDDDDDDDDDDDEDWQDSGAGGPSGGERIGDGRQGETLIEFSSCSFDDNNDDD